MLLKILREEFSRRVARNSKYSLRAFALSLKIHSSTLSAILSEKREISPLQAQKIMRELGLGNKERKAILLKMINEKSESPARVYKELDDDIFKVISGWEHFALLSCLDLKSGEKTCYDLSTKLQISQDIVNAALQRLEKLGLANRDNDRWISSGQSFTTTHEIPSEAIRRTHREYIHKALVSLDRNSVEERDITGMTMAISSRQLPTAKRMIANFRRELSEYLESGPTDEVYRLNVQLFPLTK